MSVLRISVNSEAVWPNTTKSGMGINLTPNKVIIIQVGSIGKWAPALAFWFVNKHSTKVVLRYCFLFCKLTIIKWYVMMKLLYLARIGVEVLLKFIAYIVVNHQTLISNWRCQMGSENLPRGGCLIISRLIAVISRGALIKTDSVIFNWSFLDTQYKTRKLGSNS